jgi:hypothetical protein
MVNDVAEIISGGIELRTAGWVGVERAIKGRKVGAMATAAFPPPAVNQRRVDKSNPTIAALATAPFRTDRRDRFSFWNMGISGA